MAVSFDGVPYYEVAKLKKFALVPMQRSLPSDAEQRGDVVGLKKGDLRSAQGAQDVIYKGWKIEEKLRKNAAKARKKAGGGGGWF